MSLLIGHWGKAAVLFIGIFTLLTLSRELQSRPGSAAPVLDADSVRVICERASYPEHRFLERVRIMGAAGLLFRDVPLSRYLKSAEALLFSEKEIGKLRAAGLADPGTPLSPGTVWIKDEHLLERVKRAAAAHGISLKPRRHGKMHVVELVSGGSPAEVSTGFDLPAVERAASSGLRPVFSVGSAPGLRLIPKLDREPVLLLEPGLANDAEGLRLLRERIGAGAAWAAVTDEARGDGFLRGLDIPLSRVIPAGSVRLSDGLDAALSASKGKGAGLLLLGLDRTSGVEESLGALRRTLRGLRAHRVGPSLQARSLDTRVPGRVEALVRRGAALLIVCLGPILALRLGIRVLRAMNRAGRLPEAAPFLAGFSAMAVIAAAGACLGSAAHASLAVGDWRFLPSAPVWISSAASGSLFLGVLALFLPEPAQMRRAGRREAAGAAVLLAMVVVAGILLFPPQPVLDWGPRAWLRAASSLFPSLWWAPDRWIEICVGFPCLFVAACLFDERLEKSSGKTGPDPRRWLLLGLFGPLGTISALAMVRTPFEIVLIHTPLAAGAGVVLGLLFYGVRRAVLQAVSGRSKPG